MDTVERYAKEMLLQAWFEDNLATDELIPTIIETLCDRLSVKIEKKLHNADAIREFRQRSEKTRPEERLASQIPNFASRLADCAAAFAHDYITRMKRQW